jgi:putative PIN family toxin of toxin-antitoxin system
VQKEKVLFSVVYDCMIFLQGLISESGIAVNCFELFENGIIELFVSEEILAEIQDVITRPKLQAKYNRLTNERAEKLIEILRTKATVIKKVPSVFSYARDPKDEKYINLAVASGAEYIVSRDTDLLDLMTGYDDDSREFRQRFRPLKVIEPLEFLKIVEEH